MLHLENVKKHAFPWCHCDQFAFGSMCEWLLLWLGCKCILYMVIWIWVVEALVCAHWHMVVWRSHNFWAWILTPNKSAQVALCCHHWCVHEYNEAHSGCVQWSGILPSIHTCTCSWGTSTRWMSRIRAWMCKLVHKMWCDLHEILPSSSFKHDLWFHTCDFVCWNTYFSIPLIWQMCGIHMWGNTHAWMLHDVDAMTKTKCLKTNNDQLLCRVMLACTP